MKSGSKEYRNIDNKVLEYKIKFNPTMPKEESDSDSECCIEEYQSLRKLTLSNPPVLKRCTKKKVPKCCNFECSDCHFPLYLIGHDCNKNKFFACYACGRNYLLM